MNEGAARDLDPRIRRTRQLLRNALEDLLQAKEFDKISVQDIADAATVNRVTFYDHYDDKYELLQCVVAARFHELLKARGISFDGTCASALRAIVLAVCDYLSQTAQLGCERLRQLGPHLQSAVIRVVRELVLDGFRRHGVGISPVPPEFLATSISWTMYGLAQEWVEMPDRRSPEDMVDIIMNLVTPTFALAHPETN